MIKRLTIICCTVLACLLSISVMATNVRVLGARFSETPGNTRIVLVLSGETSYKNFILHKPYRAVVDINHASMATDLNDLHLGKGVVSKIRESHHGSDGIRVVFDLKQPAKMKVFLLKPEQTFKTRLVIDLSDIPQPHSAKEMIKGVPPNAANAKLKPILQAEPPLKQKLRDVIVVVDPGHGGKDPGATGPHGIKEKNVVLAIGKDLRVDLNKIPGIHADLTRKGDYYITLRDRLRIARKDKADLFIAIHADAFQRRSAEGASVFALSERGATSEAARWLAERENYSELGGVKDFSDKSKVVRSVLLDLSQTVTISQSLIAGQDILNRLKNITVLHNTKVEQARFVVLKSPDIPSLLVETGFISNPSEERRLNSPSYQHRLAMALAKGIESYFWQHPPRGTLFSGEKRARIYRVRRGDTLNKLAERFHTNVSTLRRLNDMNGYAIDVGQNIRIPTR